MNRGSCPCTVLTLTRNSEGSVTRFLKSGLFAKEHLVLDGGSQDKTLEFAMSYGCRVVQQNRKFLDGNNRIIDYAGVRNQGVRAASYDWIVMIDSDEYIDAAMTAEIERIVETMESGAYEVTRLYVCDGHVIRYASTYPNRQIRFFHRDAINGFMKSVHERPDVKVGVLVKVLPGVQYVPLTRVSDLKRKFTRYIRLEVEAAKGRGWLGWFTSFVDKNLRLGLRTLRIIHGRLFHRWRDSLPLKYELLYFWYTWMILWRTFFTVLRATLHSSHRDVQTINPNG